MTEPLLIGRRWRIVSPGTPAAAGRVDIVLTPGAFGSGEHETTASCLEVLETRPEVHDATVLDLGSGTGVLALAALRLGARAATCVDTSPGAVETARANGLLNDLDQSLRHLAGTIADVQDRDYSLVIANLYGDLLLELADAIVGSTRAGGLILLSGMLWEYWFDVNQRFERLGCQQLEHRMLDEFATLLLKKS